MSRSGSVERAARGRRAATRGARPGRPSTANCPGWNGGYVQPSGATRMMTSPGATSIRCVSTAFSSARATPLP